MKNKILIGLAFACIIAALAGMSASSGTGSQLLMMPDHSANPVFSEINVEIYGFDSAYGLNITGPQNVTVPMINDFNFIMHSPGNSTYRVDVGNRTIAAGNFAWVGSASVNTSYNGTVIITVQISSSILSHTSSFTYILNIMTPLTYINYEHSKTIIIRSLSYDLLGEGITASALTVYIYAIIMRHGVVKPRQDAMDDAGGIYRSG